MNRSDMSNESVARRKKREELLAEGAEPYADRYETTHTIQDASELPAGTQSVSVAGRIVSLRNFGKLVFGHVSSSDGRLQFAIQKQTLNDRFDRFCKIIDVADYIGFKGEMITTRTGEKTLSVLEWSILSKALRPLPEKFHGIADKEQILRKRYLDLVMSPESVSRFRARSRIIRYLRDYLDKNGFIELDTPILTGKASGALAVPFATHHNALNFDVFLRIAPETYLKRAVVGGFDRVYEMARCFRNEGMDRSHLPDFTMLEYYVSYWDFKDNMAFTEQFVKDLVRDITGSLEIEYQGQSIDFGGKWQTRSFRELLKTDTGIDIAETDNKDRLEAEIQKRRITLDIDRRTENIGFGNLVDILYKKVSRPKLINPTFLIEHPIDVSPLARRNSVNANIVDRFQLVVNGWEVINAYSELIDPVEQRTRLQKQMEARTAGDNQAMDMDEDFITAMEYGMPPMSGWGMGVDRIVALLTNAESLRDVVLFPLMKPE